jgi:adenylate cyclase
LRRYLTRLALPLVLIGVLLAHVAGYVNVPYIDDIERLLYDTRIRYTAPGGVDRRIVIAAIDEPSLAAEGHWPWTRDKLATLVEQLFSYGAVVVGFDMVFAERDESADVQLLKGMADPGVDAGFLQRLEQFEPYLDRDQIFADALGVGPAVLGYYFDTNEATAFETGQLPFPAFELSEGMAGSVYLPVAHGYGANLEVLVNNAYSAGFINNPLIDKDGIVRRAPLLHLYGPGVYESLSLATAAVYLNDITLPVFVDMPAGLSDYPPLEGLELAGNRIPIDAEGGVLVPYRGPAGSFPYLSATRIIRGTLVNADLLENAIVLVAATAPGLLDIKATPFGSIYPGVEVHANVIAGMLDNNMRWQPAYTVAMEMLFVVVIGVLMALILPLLNPYLSTGLALLIFGAAVGVNLYLWEVKLHVLPLAVTLYAILGVYVLNMVFGYFFETRARSQMDGLFGQYVPPDLVRNMSKDPENYSLESEKRELTVLFSDIRDFTRISESLDAADLSDMMQRYLTPMTRIIHESKGTIDKYIGDAVMAFWGAPLHDPAHAANAIRASLGMLAALDGLNDELEHHGMPRIQIGIGLNTGMMNVGNMGSQFRRAYTVLGDAVNLGSRLEGLTKAYGVGLIVGETTRAAAPEYACRRIDRVRVKGKQEPVTIWEPVGLKAELSAERRHWVDEFNRFQDEYGRQNWDECERILRELQAGEPEAYLYRLYLERIRLFREAPPPGDWDGVFTHESK